VLFHVAAVYTFWTPDPKTMYEANVQGTANLLDILANEKHCVKKVLVAASMSSYGEGRYECGKCGTALRVEDIV